MFGKVSFLLAALLVCVSSNKIQLKGFKYDPKLNVDQVKSLEGEKALPVVVDSNLPADMQNYALSYVASAKYDSGLIEAAAFIKQSMAENFGTFWNVAINPEAFYVNSYYFAHFIADGDYHVVMYNVNCPL